MVHRIRSFLSDEDGAVTVDWVVLTAGIIALTIGAYANIEDGSLSMTSNTNDYMAAQSPE